MVLTLLVLGVAGGAKAQVALGEGVDLRVFPLSPLGGGLTFPGAAAAPAGALRLALAPEMGLGLLSVDDEALGLRLEYAVLGSLQLTDALAVGLRVPRVQYQTLEPTRLREAGVQVEDPRTGGWSDFGLAGRWTLTRPAARWRFAVTGEVLLPTGAADAFMGTGTLSFAPALLGEVDAGPLTFGARTGYRWRPGEGTLLGRTGGDRLGLGAAARVRLGGPLPEGSQLSLEVQLESPALGDPWDEALPTAAEAALGLLLPLPHGVFVTSGLGRGLTASPGYGSEALRAFLMVGWEGPLAPSQGNPGHSEERGLFMGDAYRFANLPLVPRMLHTSVAIPANARFWGGGDWARFALFGGLVGALMLPLDPSPDVRLDRWITANLDDRVPDLWGAGPQAVLWSTLAAGGLGTWAWATWTGQPYVAQGLSLMVESLGVVQMYHLVLKLLIGREGPTDRAGLGRIHGPGGGLIFYPAGTPGGHAGTLYSLMSAGFAWFAPPGWVQGVLQVVVGGLALTHVINHRHFISDAVWGAAMGWYIGQWVVAHRGSPVPETGGMRLVPIAVEGGGGLGMAGRFE